jgi:hypothetical protein
VGSVPPMLFESALDRHRRNMSNQRRPEQSFTLAKVRDRFGRFFFTLTKG